MVREARTRSRARSAVPATRRRATRSRHYPRTRRLRCRPGPACTEIYGGPDTLSIKGTIDGEPVDATFTRANGCEIERFDRFAELLKELFPDYRPGAAITG